MRYAWYHNDEFLGNYTMQEFAEKYQFSMSYVYKMIRGVNGYYRKDKSTTELNNKSEERRIFCQLIEQECKKLKNCGYDLDKIKIMKMR